MKKQDIYNAWKQQKSQIQINQNFSSRVMNQIRQYKKQNEKQRNKPLLDKNKEL